MLYVIGARGICVMGGQNVLLICHNDLLLTLFKLLSVLSVDQFSISIPTLLLIYKTLLQHSR